MANLGIVYHVDDKDYNSDKTEITIPEGYKSIAVSAFERDRLVEKVNLPSTLIEIRSAAFDGCDKLQSIVFPKGINLIKTNAFSRCDSLKEVVIPDSVTHIGMTAFEGCKGLKSAKLPAKLKTLEYGVFRSCTSLESVVLPKKLQTIDSNAFSSCKSLKSVEIPSKVRELGYAMFTNCFALKDVKLPKGLKKIAVASFDNCESLENILIPSGVKEIESAAFQGCTKLKEIELPKRITYLADRTFVGCVALKEVVVPTRVESIGNSAFSDCYRLESVSIPQSVRSIGEYAFSNCNYLKNIQLPKKIKEIDRGTFLNCASLEEIDVSGVNQIMDEAFKGCKKLKKLTISDSIELVGARAFEGCDFNYIYKEKGKNNLVFSQALPEDQENCEKIVDLNLFKECIMDFDVGVLVHEQNLNEITAVAEKLSKEKMVIPNVYLQKYMLKDALDELANELDYRFIRTELPDLRIRVAMQGDTESLAFFKFARALGCFSSQKILDKNGRETDALVAQKASSTFATIVKNELIKPGKFDSLFSTLPINAKVDQEFLKFISVKGENREFKNLELLLRLEEENKGLMSKVVSRFDEVISLRVALDEKGKPYTLSWEKALLKFHKFNNFLGVTDENKDIAEVFTEKGINQEGFDRAARLREVATKDGVRAHILEAPLKEETIVEKIERIKNQTEATLVDNKSLLDELYEQKFTYEMLDKHDPRNAIIGVYCSCCATISGNLYGKDIAASTITEHDVQNLVVRDQKGEIVAKGTMYVNQNKGYAVINDFEMNRDYRAHETDAGGWYDVNSEHKDEQERELIFKAFTRGIKAFVKQYDIEHPDKPIQKVNVGMGYNRLKLQCTRYKEETDNLRIPVEYSFHDAEESQRVLYERGVEENKLFVKSKDEDRSF